MLWMGDIKQSNQTGRSIAVSSLGLWHTELYCTKAAKESVYLQNVFAFLIWQLLHCSLPHALLHVLIVLLLGLLHLLLPLQQVLRGVAIVLDTSTQRCRSSSTTVRLTNRTHTVLMESRWTLWNYLITYKYFCQQHSSCFMSVSN